MRNWVRITRDLIGRADPTDARVTQPNGHQQRTEDQRTHHQRPGRNIIHIGQEFMQIQSNKIPRENRVKGKCSYSNRGSNVFTSGFYMYFLVLCLRFVYGEEENY